MKYSLERTKMVQR